MHPQPDRYKSEVFNKFFAEAMASKGALAIIDAKNSEVFGTSRYAERVSLDKTIKKFEPLVITHMARGTALLAQMWDEAYRQLENQN